MVNNLLMRLGLRPPTAEYLHTQYQKHLENTAKAAFKTITKKLTVNDTVVADVKDPNAIEYLAALLQISGLNYTSRKRPYEYTKIMVSLYAITPRDETL